MSCTCLCYSCSPIFTDGVIWVGTLATRTLGGTVTGSFIPWLQPVYVVDPNPAFPTPQFLYSVVDHSYALHNFVQSMPFGEKHRLTGRD